MLLLFSSHKESILDYYFELLISDIINANDNIKSNFIYLYIINLFYLLKWFQIHGVLGFWGFGGGGSDGLDDAGGSDVG